MELELGLDLSVGEVEAIVFIIMWKSSGVIVWIFGGNDRGFVMMS